jgi:hypothetical protein
LKLCGDSVRAGYFGNTSGTIYFGDNAVLTFTCDENGVSALREVGADDLDSALIIDEDDTVLEVDLSRLRLPAGKHRLVLVKIDRLEGRFARERFIGVRNATVTAAKIVYDPPAGEIRLHLICNGNDDISPVP